VSADAGRTHDADVPAMAGAIPGTEKGSKRWRFDPFQLISHAVTGRLACLSLAPALPIVMCVM
jgi:hypothetical protein